MIDLDRINWLERGGFLKILVRPVERDGNDASLVFKFSPGGAWRPSLREAIDDEILREAVTGEGVIT